MGKATAKRPVSSGGYAIRLFHVAATHNRYGLHYLNLLTFPLLNVLCQFDENNNS